MEDMTKESKEKIEQLQLLEQNLNAIVGQKQQFQSQILESESAISELEGVGKAYKIIGNIMVESPRDILIKDLTSKKEIHELRLKALDKQEQNIRAKAAELQKEILSNMDDKNANK
ncbi:MAG: prefoldin subunit beta [archaeon]